MHYANELYLVLHAPKVPNTKEKIERTLCHTCISSLLEEVNVDDYVVMIKRIITGVCEDRIKS